VPSIAISEEILTRFRATSAERIDRTEGNWQALFERREGRDSVAELRRDLHTLKGDAHVIGFMQLELLCHKLEDLFAFALQKGFDVPEPVDLMMTMGLRLSHMLLMGSPGTPVAGVDLDGFVKELDEVVRDARKLDESTQAPRRRKSIAGMERADALDADARAQLSIAATMVFMESLNAQGPSRARLRSTWERLQSLVAKVTSVPLAPRISHLAKAASELAQSMGRKVDIEVACDGFQVPPEIAETLDSALVHLLRNAVDHGIEPPDVRRATGKNEQASIRISAIERGGFTEVSVIDDGRGIDTDRVKRIAVERSIITPERARDLQERDVWPLIFKPGFSTAASVTDISGRGIGLDAVRAAVEDRGGTVEVRSRRGQGTTMLMRLARATARTTVHTFRVPGGPVLLAVSAEWAAVQARPLGPKTVTSSPPLDVLDALGIVSVQTRASERILRLERGSQQVSLRAVGEVEVRMAERLCQTPLDYVAEVVTVEGEESLFVRPELLVQTPLTTGVTP
jgi:two-component system chemotaxis sensor kinase CheA